MSFSSVCSGTKSSVSSTSFRVAKNSMLLYAFLLPQTYSVPSSMRMAVDW